MNSWENEYPVGFEQQVIWGDMDAFGHVNNTVYFRYFEDARIAYFDKLGMLEHQQKANMGPILASTHCNFKRPLTYPDRIRIATRGTILSPKKLAMHYIVYSEKLDAVAAEGEGLIIYYDYANNRSCDMPAAIITTLKALESGNRS